MSLITGILLSILAYSMLNIGIVLEKKEAASLPNIEDTDIVSNLKNFLTNKIWIVGFILTAVPWYIYLIALAYAPLSIIAPFTGVGMVVLTISSYFYLHERISRLELLGILVTITGLIILGSSMQDPSVTYSLQEMTTIVFNWTSILLILAYVAFAAILSTSTVRLNYKYADIFLGISSGICAGIGGIFSKALSPGLNDLLRSLGMPIFWFFILFAGAGNLISMVLQNLGFQKGRAVILGPTFSVMSVLAPTTAGVIIFREWNALELVNITFQLSGIAIISVGIVILSWFGALKKHN